VSLQSNSRPLQIKDVLISGAGVEPIKPALNVALGSRVSTKNMVLEMNYYSAV